MYALLDCAIFAACVAAASAASISITRALPWSPAARMAGFPSAVAFGIAPFLFGFVVVLALGVLPGYSHAAHVAFVGGALLAFWFAGRRVSLSGPQAPPDDSSWRACWRSWPAWVLLVFSLVILGAAFLSPLSANDPLEYAIVGRILYDTRAIATYPILDPEGNTFGFYGPWTHPPLYVALLYFTNIIQGALPSPDGVAKLISPWFAISSAGIVAAIGRLKSLNTGLVAAILFLATPLLATGAVSAHIDPLAVAGFALAMSIILGVRASPIASGVIQGTAIGLAMWTHSQAVLLIPVMLTAAIAYEGWTEKRRLLIQVAGILIGVIAVAGWPYARNLAIYGSIINDTPEIYALKSLQWDQYFRIARGYAHWPDRIQFGLFKVWNADGFGLAYWLMPIGALIFATRAVRSVPLRILIKGEMSHVPDRWLLAPIGALLCYFAGIAASILAGLDVMIRNDRYQVIALPAVCLVAAYAAILIVERFRSSIVRKRLLGRSLTAPMLVASLLGAGILLIKVPGQEKSLRKIFAEGRGILPSRLADVGKLRMHVPKGATVLSLRPSDMYYAERRMVSYLDPRLVQFYDEKDTRRAFELLRNMEIAYVYMPNYFLPPAYNSQLKEILADRRFSEIILASPNVRLYRLTEQQNSGVADTIFFGDGEHCWTTVESTTQAAGRIVCGDKPAVVAPRWPLNLRLQSATLASGKGSNLYRLDEDAMLRVVGGHEYRLDLDMLGRAFPQIAVYFYGQDGRFLEYETLGDTLLDSDTESRRLPLRFVAPAQCVAIRVVINLKGKSRLRIQSGSLKRIFYRPAIDSSHLGERTRSRP